jgi:hypothetical protein
MHVSESSHMKTRASGAVAIVVRSNIAFERTRELAAWLTVKSVARAAQRSR